MVSCISLVALNVLLLAGTVWSKVPSDTLLSFLTMYNGHFDNSAQAQDNRDYDLLVASIRPVDVPALHQDITVILEQSRGDQVLRLQAYTITEDDEGNIHLRAYLFTDPSQHRPGDYDVADLQILGKDDFHRNDDCNEDCVYALEEDGVFMGTCVSCAHMVAGVYPRYALTVTCHSIDVVMAMGAVEHFQPVPYNYKPKGSRYALPPHVLENVSDFVNPCDV